MCSRWCSHPKALVVFYSLVVIPMPYFFHMLYFCMEEFLKIGRHVYYHYFPFPVPCEDISCAVWIEICYYGHACPGVSNPAPGCPPSERV